MQLAESHIAVQQTNPIRLQEYAVGIFKTVPTKSGIKKAIKKGLLLVDGQATSTALSRRSILRRPMCRNLPVT